jgi:hypothetical protein
MLDKPTNRNITLEKKTINQSIMHLTLGRVH